MTTASSSAETGTPLSDRAVQHLARARFWARLAGVCGLVPGGILFLFVGVAHLIGGRTPGLAIVMPILGLLIFPGGPAVLLLLYARNLGRPALGPAFANLRALWVVTTFTSAAFLLVAFLLRR